MKGSNLSHEELRRRVEQAAAEGVSLLVDPRPLLRLFDRLRAAEEVIVQARQVYYARTFRGAMPRLREALRRYDEAVKG